MKKTKKSKKLSLENHLMKHFVVGVLVVILSSLFITLYSSFGQFSYGGDFGYYYVYLATQFLVPALFYIASFFILPKQLDHRQFWVFVSATVAMLIFITLQTIALQIQLETVVAGYEGHSWVQAEIIKTGIALGFTAGYYLYLYKIITAKK